MEKTGASSASSAQSEPTQILAKPKAQKSDTGAKVPKLPVIEGLNWLLHLYFVRKDFKACKELIKQQLDMTNGMCEYALYIQGF